MKITIVTLMLFFTSLCASSFSNMSDAEISKATDRLAKISGIKAGCKTQAQIACYTDNIEFCQKVGINKFYKTCLSLSSFEKGVAAKVDVMNVLETSIKKQQEIKTLTTTQNSKQEIFENKFLIIGLLVFILVGMLILVYVNIKKFKAKRNTNS